LVERWSPKPEVGGSSPPCPARSSKVRRAARGAFASARKGGMLERAESLSREKACPRSPRPAASAPAERRQDPYRHSAPQDRTAAFDGGLQSSTLSHWISQGGGCDTRKRVLIRDGRNVRIGSGCRITSHVAQLLRWPHHYGRDPGGHRPRRAAGQRVALRRQAVGGRTEARLRKRSPGQESPPGPNSS
jgi:hypothetical protein